jgi:hypothetical protein
MKYKQPFKFIPWREHSLKRPYTNNGNNNNDGVDDDNLIVVFQHNA